MFLRKQHLTTALGRITQNGSAVTLRVSRHGQGYDIQRVPEGDGAETDSSSCAVSALLVDR